jgi:uncharacterized protein (DUF1684 family)
MRAILTTLLVVGLAASAADPSSYQRTIADWRAQHEAELKADNGWLTVVGLHWLKEGANRVGSNPGYEVVLPATAPANLGVITVKSGKAHFTPAPGAPATINGVPARAPAQTIDLRTDAEPTHDTITTGRINFFVIQREDKLAVRVKDNDSATRKNFSGERWYPVDPAWRIQASYLAWDKPHSLTFDTLVGVKETDPSPGFVTFKRNGVEYRLEPVLEDDHFFFVMRDATSGKTTYSASRFLYSPLPKDGPNGKTVELDFNKAENPPCVFTDFATCPLPPPQNRLKLEVTAGELMYGAHH